MIIGTIVGLGRLTKIICKTIQNNNFLKKKYFYYNKIIKRGLFDKSIIIINNKINIKFKDYYKDGNSLEITNILKINY